MILFWQNLTRNKPHSLGRSVRPTFTRVNFASHLGALERTDRRLNLDR
jgi:hypothetical protein